jgi:GTP-binding protein EngB required for normal cell division
MFSSTHRGYLLARFRHIEELLGEAVAALEPGEDVRLFRRVTPDATSTQRRILTDYLGQIRYALRRFMEAQQLEDTASPVSGLWSVRTAVIFAQTAVAELRPVYLRGYGQLDSEAMAACERLVAELTTLLKRVSDYLDKGTEGDLAARLARLDAARTDVAALRELDRIIMAHGIVELRAPLEELIERAANPRYEVAVFGRVSVGKSTLINWWLGGAVLPTGVTPVTAVPTRIVHGEISAAHVQVASSGPEVVPLDRIASYITEAGNPGNSKRVLGVTIEIPSERLAEGIRLVDTPGLGSLATAGAIQTLEYLPRCDLALQLIEAGGAVGREEIDLARAVLDGGSELLITLSKADRLTAPELAEAHAYVARLFATALGVAVPVHTVSTVGSSAALAQEWFDRELAPRLADHRARADAQLRRKIEVLREKVSAALEARIRSTPRPAARRASGGPAGEMAEHGSRARLQLERARSELRQMCLRVREVSSWILESAADTLARCWADPTVEERGIAGQVGQTLVLRALEIGEAIAECLARCRDDINGALNCVTPPASASRLDEEWPPRGRPIFDSTGLFERIPSKKPWWAPKLQRLLRHVARQRLGAGTQTLIEGRLSVYSEALWIWGSSYLEQLGRRLDEALAADESRARLGGAAPLAPEAAAAARRDLDLLTSGFDLRKD